MLLNPVYSNIAYPPMDNDRQPRIYEGHYLHLLSNYSVYVRNDAMSRIASISVLISKSGEVFPLI